MMILGLHDRRNTWSTLWTFACTFQYGRSEYAITVDFNRFFERLKTNCSCARRQEAQLLLGKDEYVMSTSNFPR